MGDKTAIGWTDATWNPVTGCSKVSPGCANCYAETLTARYAGTNSGFIAEHRPWTPANAAHNVVLRPERLEQPLRWTKPRMVFVNSMSDLFHEQVPDDYIAQVFAVMAAATEHTFQVLTKRPERMQALLASAEFERDVFSKLDGVPRMVSHRHHVLRTRLFSGVWHTTSWPLRNVWLGVSIENRRYVGRADLLRETPAAVRFISAEPLLGPLVYDGEVGTGAHYAYEGPRTGSSEIMQPAWADGREGNELDLTGIDWLIVGGESGSGHRPMRPGWACDLRDAAAAQGFIANGEHYEFARGGARPACAFFFKQWGGATPKSGGRELDGRTWDEIPEPPKQKITVTL